MPWHKGKADTFAPTNAVSRKPYRGINVPSLWAAAQKRGYGSGLSLRAEAQQHWKNLEQAVIAHNPYALVNSAASLSEALLRQFLAVPGPNGENFGAMLDRLKTELEKKKSAFSLIGYHFMQTVRIMHQSTQHPGRVAATGRPIRPGLALTMAEGIVEVLTSVGMIQ